jgi:hypothetical protein
VFVIACALAGLQGVRQAHYIRYVGPESYSVVQSLTRAASTMREARRLLGEEGTHTLAAIG